MIACPNRRRSARVHRGGGSLACRGHLVVVLAVPVVLPLRSLGRWRSGPLPEWEDVARARVQRHGLRVPAAQLREAYTTGAADLRCDSCAWSARRLLAAAKPRPRRR